MWCKRQNFPPRAAQRSALTPSTWPLSIVYRFCTVTCGPTPDVTRPQLRVVSNDVERPDEALIAATLAGDGASFDQLVARYYPVCLRFAWRQLGSRADAEDVVQEALLRAYGNLARCTQPLRFRSWLLSIVVNRCRSWSVRQRRRSALVLRWWKPEAATAADQGVSANEVDIHRLLQTLSPALREAFLLKHVEELEYEDMARITGVGVSALKMRVKRAADALAERLKEANNE
jgi:RNA polymerase sigma-70 factor, ECF subfamily